MPSGSEKYPHDRWSHDAKEEDEYWLCECGIARQKAGAMFDHCEEDGHIAELVQDDGTVVGILASGFEMNKYAGNIPETAMIKRKKLKNEPLFPKYEEE